MPMKAEEVFALLSSGISKKADKDKTAVQNNIAVFDDNGNPVDSGVNINDVVQYIYLTVGITGTDGLQATGITVVVKQTETGEEYARVPYNGQPVSMQIPNGFGYTVTTEGSWEGHYKPTPSSVSGIADGDKTVAIVYSSMSVPESLAELAEIVQNGGAGNLIIGTQFTITWRDVAAGVDYDVPVDIVSVQTVEDENGVEHEAAIIQWHYALPFTIAFDAPEQVEATEETAQSGIYYYGYQSDGDVYTLLDLSAGDTIPYSEYTNIYKNAVEDSTCNIIRYGYNRYRDSAYRQFLRSAAAKNQWWEATHVGDVAPAQLAQKAGFLSGFSDDDLALMKKSKITCTTNNITDGGVIDVMHDKWYLPSATEMYGVANDGEGTYFDYWKQATGYTEPNNAANDGRIAYSLNSQTVAATTRLRSASRTNSGYVWDCGTSGNIGYSSANNAYAALPACAIY